MRATLATELLVKLAQLRDPIISAAVLEVASGMLPESSTEDPNAVQRAMIMMDETLEADALWSSHGDGGRWARPLSKSSARVPVQRQPARQT